MRFILAAPAMTGQMIALDGGQHLGWAQPQRQLPVLSRACTSDGSDEVSDKAELRSMRAVYCSQAAVTDGATVRRNARLLHFVIDR